MTIKRSKQILLVIAVLSITLITAIAIPFSLIRAESAPNDMDYETKNLVPNLGYTFIQQGTCPYYYDTLDRSIHFNIGSPYTAGNFVFSKEKIQLKPNTKYTLTYKVESTKPINTTVIYLANNGKATDWLNISNWYEFTTAPDTQFVQLYFYPDLSFKNVDFKLTISELMLYEGSNDGRAYEPKGGWYWAGAEDTYNFGRNVITPFMFLRTIIHSYPANVDTYTAFIPLIPFVDYTVALEGYNGSSTLEYSIFYFLDNGRREFWDGTYYDEKGNEVVLLNGQQLNKDITRESFKITDEIRQYYIQFKSKDNFTQDEAKRTLRLYAKGFVYDTTYFDEIYSSGYNEGQADGVKIRNSIPSLIPTVFGSASTFILSFLNYEVFGISLMSFMGSLAVVILIIWLIKSFT